MECSSLKSQTYQHQSHPVFQSSTGPMSKTQQGHVTSVVSMLCPPTRELMSELPVKHKYVSHVEKELIRGCRRYRFQCLCLSYQTQTAETVFLILHTKKRVKHDTGAMQTAADQLDQWSNHGVFQRKGCAVFSVCWGREEEVRQLVIATEQFKKNLCSLRKIVHRNEGSGGK